jgi:1,4-alpha-glucan branching enzyme
LRKDNKISNTIIFVVNFTPVPRTIHRIGVPYKGEYIEILNSDEKKYGGSGIVNSGILLYNNIFWDGREESIEIKLPPLAVVALKYLE